MNKIFIGLLSLSSLFIYCQEEYDISHKEQYSMSDNWKDQELPDIQRNSIVNLQLNNIKNGIVDEVFQSLLDALNSIDMKSFTLLDAACASGYYYEVLKSLEPRMAHYTGSDYSAAMVKCAQKYYPNVPFIESDATALKFPSNSFDVVVLAGVVEHIPAYQKALSEACRVAKHYVVIHRLPISMTETNRYTHGPQYNIDTPKTYFSFDHIKDAMASHKTKLTFCTNIYQDRNDVKTVVFEKVG